MAVTFTRGWRRLGDMRSDDTALEEDLASDGFVVVAIDHTHEAHVHHDDRAPAGLN